MAQARAGDRYKKAEIKAQKHLSAAADALRDMYKAAVEAELPVKGLDDTRLTLQQSCREYAEFLAVRIERNL